MVPCETSLLRLPMPRKPLPLSCQLLLLAGAAGSAIPPWLLLALLLLTLLLLECLGRARADAGLPGSSRGRPETAAGGAERLLADSFLTRLLTLFRFLVRPEAAASSTGGVLDPKLLNPALRR